MKKFLLGLLLSLSLMAPVAAQVTSVTINNVTPACGTTGNTVNVTFTVVGSGTFKTIAYDVLFSTSSTASSAAWSSKLQNNMVCTNGDPGFSFNDNGNTSNTVVQKVTVPSSIYRGNIIVIAVENSPYVFCTSQHSTVAFTNVCNTNTPTNTPTSTFTPTPTSTVVPTATPGPTRVFPFYSPNVQGNVYPTGWFYTDVGFGFPVLFGPSGIGLCSESSHNTSIRLTNSGAVIIRDLMGNALVAGNDGSLSLSGTSFNLSTNPGVGAVISMDATGNIFMRSAAAPMTINAESFGVAIPFDPLNMGGNQVNSIADPSHPHDAASEQYVIQQIQKALGTPTATPAP